MARLCVAYFAASLGLALGLIAIFGPDDFLRGPLLPVVVAGPHVFLMLHATWVSRSKGQGLVADFKLALTGSDIGLAFGLFVGSLFSAAIVGVIIVEIVGEAPTAAAIDVARESSDDRLTVWIFLFAFLGATFVPLAEEVVYRGMLWSALEKRGMNPWLILLTTSALFAFIHLELTRTPVLFVVGIGLGLGRLFTGRIGASILTHVFINSLAMFATIVELA